MHFKNTNVEKFQLSAFRVHAYDNRCHPTTFVSLGMFLNFGVALMLTGMEVGWGGLTYTEELLYLRPHGPIVGAHAERFDFVEPRPKGDLCFYYLSRFLIPNLCV